MEAPSLESLATGLCDLRRFERGHAAFEIGVDGEIAYTGTDATVRMLPDESIPDFFDRLRRDYGLRPGDGVHLIANGRSQLDTARVLRRAS
jgi:hypothetical protein